MKARAVVKARNTLAPFGGELGVTEAIIVLDSWLAKQPERVKRDLARYFGAENLPVAARPDEFHTSPRSDAKADI